MENKKVSFATIVATGEQPSGAIHAARVGQDVATEFNATGKDTIALTACIVKDALDLSRREGGRIVADLLAAVVIHELGSTVNSPMARRALELASKADPAQEVNEDAEV